MKTILLLDTSVGSLNQGDEIINYSINKNWQSLFNKNYILRLATHTPMYSAFQTFLYKKKLSVIKNADYKFLCGTNALYTNMLRPMPNWNINIMNCSLLGNTICLGVGIGTNSEGVNWYTKKLYKKVLSKDYIHSTRDEKTREFLIKLGYRAVNTGCPTLWGLTPEHCRQIAAKKSDSVIFTLTYYTPDIDNDKLLINILRKNYNKIYFWPQCLNDLKYLEQLGNINDIEIVSPNLSSYATILDEKIDYIGNRLHGGIFAMQHKCRSIILAIDYRAREMHKNYSFKCIERNDINDKLPELINTEWNTELSGLNFDLIETWKKQFEL